ncbi:GIP [Symbiodinium sp. CCMP2592]|nr:GIP [Symbiodinium sp. CCMP2592]
MPPATQAPTESAPASSSPGSESSFQLPWNAIPRFTPGTTDVTEYSKKLQLLAAMWPKESISLLAPRAALLCEGTAFKKVAKLSADKLKSNDESGVQLLVAIFGTIQKADESNDSYLARHDVHFEELLSQSVTLEDVRAYVLLRQSALSAEERKKIVVEMSGALKYDKVRSAIRLLGSRFFSDLQGQRGAFRSKTYDANVVEDSGFDEPDRIYHAAATPSIAEDYEGELEPEYLEALIAAEDGDALVVQNFEEELESFFQETPEMQEVLVSYMEARSRLLSKRKVRRFWPVSGHKGGRASGKGAKGKGKGKGSREQLLARIAKSTCRACGERGHWKAECPKYGRPGSMTAANKTEATTTFAEECPEQATAFMTGLATGMAGEEILTELPEEAVSLAEALNVTGAGDVEPRTGLRALRVGPRQAPHVNRGTVDRQVLWLGIEVVAGSTPLLFSKRANKQLGGIIDTNDDTCCLLRLGKKLQLRTSATGLYMLDLARLSEETCAASDDQCQHACEVTAMSFKARCTDVLAKNANLPKPAASSVEVPAETERLSLGARFSRMNRAEKTYTLTQARTVPLAEVGRLTINFGKQVKGRSFEDVVTQEQSWVRWCCDHLAGSEKHEHKMCLLYIERCVQEAEALEQELTQSLDEDFASTPEVPIKSARLPKRKAAPRSVPKGGEDQWDVVVDPDSARRVDEQINDLNSRVMQMEKTELRRVHVNLGHPSPEVLARHLQAAKTDHRLIAAAREYQCDSCLESTQPLHQRPSKFPVINEFNDLIGVDGFYFKSKSGYRTYVLHAIDEASCFQQGLSATVGVWTFAVKLGKSIVWVAHGTTVIRSAPENLRPASLREWQSLTNSQLEEPWKNAGGLISDQVYLSCEEAGFHDESGSEFSHFMTLQTGDSSTAPLAEDNLPYVMEPLHNSPEQAYCLEVPLKPKEVKRWRKEKSAGDLVAVAAAMKRARTEVCLKDLSAKELTFFDQAKQKEINCWIQTSAIRAILRRKLNPEQILKSRWILTWKAPEVGETQQRAKARLVVLGFQDPKLTEVCRDAPTLSKEGRSIVLQTIASMRFQLSSFDIKTAFLRGKADAANPLAMEMLTAGSTRDEVFKGKISELEDDEYVRNIPQIDVGSLQYAVTYTRPDVAAKLGEIQGQTSGATVQTLLAANRVLREAQETSQVSLKYLPIPVDQLTFVSFGDASFASAKNLHSHQGALICATDEKLSQNQEAPVSPVAWTSKKIPRVVRSTLSAEAYAMSKAVDILGWVRALWGCIHVGNFQWQQPEAGFKQLPPATIVTDCKSLYDLVTRLAMPSCEEFRTTLEVLLIKQRCLENAHLRWIPTTLQVADSLTKPMDPVLFRTVLAQGLCKYLDHVLKCTEPPAPKFLVQLMDDFVTKYWAGNLERLLATPVEEPPPAEKEPPRRKTGLFEEFSRRVRPGEHLQETPPPLTNLKEAMLRRYAASAAVMARTKGFASLKQVRPLAARQAAKAHARPFLEAVAPEEVAEDACPLCKRHLRQKDTGVIRLRSCGHEVHGDCFNDLISGTDRFRGFSRTACPKCGELWSERAGRKQPVLPELVKVDE